MELKAHGLLWRKHPNRTTSEALPYSLLSNKDFFFPAFSCGFGGLVPLCMLVSKCLLGLFANLSNSPVYHICLLHPSWKYYIAFILESP